jgi:hypothetical protein
MAACQGFSGCVAQALPGVAGAGIPDLPERCHPPTAFPLNRSEKEFLARHPSFPDPRYDCANATHPSRSRLPGQAAPRETLAFLAPEETTAFPGLQSLARTSVTPRRSPLPLSCAPDD